MTSYKTDPTAFVKLPKKKGKRSPEARGPEQIIATQGFVPPTGETLAEYNTMDSARKEYAKYNKT